MAAELITNLPESFMAEFKDEILGTIPEEKAQVELRQQATARIMAMAGSVHIPGIGQKIAEIDGRLYFRLMQQHGDPDYWLKDFLADNPQLCAPGYRAKRRGGDLRHGFTYVGGKPVRPKDPPVKAKETAVVAKA